MGQTMTEKIYAAHAVSGSARAVEIAAADREK